MFIESNERECSPMPMSDARQDLRIVSHKFQFNYIAAGKMTETLLTLRTQLTNIPSNFN